MEKLEFVRECLQDKTEHARAIFKTGISRRTLENVMHERVNPTPATVTVLYNYFKARKGKV